MTTTIHWSNFKTWLLTILDDGWSDWEPHKECDAGVQRATRIRRTREGKWSVKCLNDQWSKENAVDMCTKWAIDGIEYEDKSQVKECKETKLRGKISQYLFHNTDNIFKRLLLKF